MPGTVAGLSGKFHSDDRVFLTSSGMTPPIHLGSTCHVSGPKAGHHPLLGEWGGQGPGRPVTATVHRAGDQRCPGPRHAAGGGTHSTDTLQPWALHSASSEGTCLPPPRSQEGPCDHEGGQLLRALPTVVPLVTSDPLCPASEPPL